MALTIEEVRKIASLARLRFTPEEESAFAGQLGKIVDYIDQLQSLDGGRSSLAESTASAAGGTPGPAGPAAPAAPTAPETADEPRPCLSRETFLANAPATLDGFLLVPEVKAGLGDDLPS